MFGPKGWRGLCIGVNERNLLGVESEVLTVISKLLNCPREKAKCHPRINHADATSSQQTEFESRVTDSVEEAQAGLKVVKTNQSITSHNLGKKRSSSC